MNILHLSPYFPSLSTNHAGGICMGKEIDTLKKMHNVYILTFVASTFDKNLIKKLNDKSVCHYVTITKFSRILHVLLGPLMPNYFAARSSFRFTLKLIWCIVHYQIDVIHAEYASMGQYLWVRNLFPHIRFNLIEHDVTIQSYERKLEKAAGIKKRYYKDQINKIFRYEKKYCKEADLVFTLNQKDRILLRQYYGLEKCCVINPYYGIKDSDILQGTKKLFETEYANICFMGQMGRDENYMAAMRLISIGKEVKQHIPELQIYIVGNKPPLELKNLENEYVHVTGFVEDVDIYLKRAQIAVFPLTMGAGIKLKVLRSLALGTPVITSSVGAEGIDEQGEVIVLAETDIEFEQCMESLIKNENECLQRSVASRDYIVERFSWKKSEEILEKVYQE